MPSGVNFRTGWRRLVSILEHRDAGQFDASIKRQPCQPSVSHTIKSFFYNNQCKSNTSTGSLPVVREDTHFKFNMTDRHSADRPEAACAFYIELPDRELLPKTPMVCKFNSV